MAGFSGASEYVKTAFIVLLGTFVVHIIAFGSPYWTTRGNGHAGLWAGCTDGVCYERWNQWVVSWIKASQTFMTMTVITLTAAILSIFIFIFHRAYDLDRRLVFLSCVMSLMSSVFIFFAVVVWAGGEYLWSGEALNWPFAMACAACLSSLTAGIFLIMELRTPRKQTSFTYTEVQDYRIQVSKY